MTVYLDVVWALNLMFDSLLLYITAILLKRRVRIWRVIAGGFIGSLIILLSFTRLSDYTNHPVAKLLFSVFMVLMVFGYKRWGYFLKGLMTLYLATFLLGGILIGTHYFIQYNQEWNLATLKASVLGFGDPISWLFVLIGFPIAWHFSKRTVDHFEMAKIQYNQLVNVNLTIDGKIYSFRGLVDSGNQLYDPISKQPVMFISIKNHLDEFSDSLIKLAGDPDSIITGSAEIPDEWVSRLRLIPCKVIGQSNQLIAAVKPDSIIIEQNGIQYLCDKGLVSFTLKELSSDDAFECIVHPKMLTGPNKHNENMMVS